MVWRLPRKAWEEGRGAKNRAAFRRIVAKGAEPGVIAYANGQPVGWCAVAPREEFGTIARSSKMSHLPGDGVWSVTCFFIEKSWRRRGASVALLKGAVEHARSHGAQVVEGYPTEPYAASMPAAFAWTGLTETFRQAGFDVAHLRSPSRPTMRLDLTRRPGRRTARTAQAASSKRPKRKQR